MQENLIVAFAFGAPYDILSNVRVANIATRKARELNTEIFTQYDVLIKADLRVYYSREEEGIYSSTLSVAKGAVQYALAHKYHKIWIAAAKPHFPRCLRDVEYVLSQFSVSDYSVHACEEIDDYPEEEWFCQRSEQKWTRSKKEWERRERILQRLPMWLYRMLS